ncbi:hypothetical protein GCM10010869_18440 [Mesorhizobium tianshanense]|uniref:5-methylcytosine-specific restriction protein A n=1 Tax=Mesorhizobium tianshanense TaxID=39844 RepID=A0A562MWC6_9HYPH|nr:5-methylcytosine-specific restriction protein A [Mesorhizobium tianshanense]GLS36255.1 hypothetical protein GCM10010869_18440 [Mesorhizobium tianshanense]
MAAFDIGQNYTRADVQETLNVPHERRGGNWDTGYSEYEGAFYVFCNIGTAGRTGHDYENYWDGNVLVWRAKNGSNVRQPQIVKLLCGNLPVHVFYREEDRRPFTYAGCARAIEIDDVTPVKVSWSFDTEASHRQSTPIAREHSQEILQPDAKPGWRTKPNRKKIPLL